MFARTLISLAVALALPAAAEAAAAGADFPSRPIRLLVPNGPGSAVDTLTRIVTNSLGPVLGQQIVIDNRAGAGGIVGMEIAKAATRTATR